MRPGRFLLRSSRFHLYIVMKVIGKSNKYYTLWEVTTDEGRSYTRTSYEYIRNLSMNRDTAMAKVPGAEVDENLHGHSSFTKVTYPKPPEDTFQGGKYRGEKVTKCTDYGYLAWAWNCAPDLLGGVKDLVEGILMDAGYRHLWGDDSFQSPEAVAEYEARQEEVAGMVVRAQNSETLEYLIQSNPIEDGTLVVEGGVVIIRFPHVAQRFYDGWSYYLPMDEKGKAKRVKNKVVRIVPAEVNLIEPNAYNYSGSIEVVVKSFEVVK